MSIASFILFGAGIISVPFLYQIDVSIHELGHALSSQILFKNSYPKIYLKGSGTETHGYTVSNLAQLSRIGALFGYSTSLGITAAAGNITELLFSILTPRIFPYSGSQVLTTAFCIISVCRILTDFKYYRENDKTNDLVHDLVQLKIQCGAQASYALMTTMLLASTFLFGITFKPFF